MGRASRDKGARGERELVRVLNELTNATWRRGIAQSRRGGAESPDVECADVDSWNGWHLEVKRRKTRVDLYAAMAQACRDAEERYCTPVVVWRVDRQPWRVTVRAGDFAIDAMTHGKVGNQRRHSGAHPPEYRHWDGPLAELVTLDLTDWVRIVCYWWPL